MTAKLELWPISVSGRHVVIDKLYIRFRFIKSRDISMDITLTHWVRMTHICVGNLTIIGSDSGLSPDRRQATTWTIDRISLMGPLGTNFSEMLIKIHTFSSKKMHLKTLSEKRWTFCLGLNVFTNRGLVTHLFILKLGHHLPRFWNIAYSVTSHNLNQWCLHVNWMHLGINDVSKIYIQDTKYTQNYFTIAPAGYVQW